MKLSCTEYKDKVHACWIGKNIGGTMGAPYEGQRKMQDIDGFKTAPNVVLPNDDLDLQLIWLYAMEQEGPYAIDCKTLGEYWLSFITPYWNEYGISKVNMRRGLVPPISGDYENIWSNSNGAWIRTEIWATLAPGCPDVAAKYALEDALVDHGAGEGTVAAVFVASMQSAAFVINDIRMLINISLSKIPESSRTAQSIRLVLKYYDEGKSYTEARNAVLEQNKDIGDGWFEAPSNVAYAVIGLVYGEGDFKKSMIYAINCGDDTDCTGATVGATLGILGGVKAIPKDWCEHIGENIVTISISRGLGIIGGIPENCTQLTERVANYAPVVLIANRTGASLYNGESDIPENISELLMQDSCTIDRLTSLRPYQFCEKTSLVNTFVTCDGPPEITAGGEKKITVSFDARTKGTINSHGNTPFCVNIRWILPEGFSVTGSPLSVYIPEANARTKGRAEFSAVINSGEKISSVNRIVLEVLADGRANAIYVPIVLIGK